MSTATCWWSTAASRRGLSATGVGLDGSAGGGYSIFDLTRGGTVLASVAMDADITRIA